MPAKPNPPQGRTLTRAHLADTVYGRMATTMELSAGLVEMMLAEIADALSRDDDVKLASFGSFLVRSKRERIGRNPKTGVEAPIAARRVVLFRASKILRDQVCGAGDEVLHEASHAVKGDEAPVLRKSA
jgi:integration host factor subunit alpha